MRWRLVSHSLAWRELDGEIVLRSAQTGSTHLLGPLASTVFRMLAEAPDGLAIEDIHAGLGDSGEPADEWYASIETVLAELRRLGLAEAHSIDRRGAD